jgi:hypothetical protein
MGSGAGAGGGGGGLLLWSQADNSAAEAVTAQISAKIFRYDFMDPFCWVYVGLT